MINQRKKRAAYRWFSIDLHIHTAASSDFKDRDIDQLQILEEAVEKKLDIIAFTDHNTIAGYRKMKDELAQLEMLEGLKRLVPEEKSRLTRYRKALKSVLLFPGIEFTATFGFHILGIFPEDKSVREIEHLLLNLNVPADQLDDGSVTIGASTDVLTAYQLIADAGGLVIAPHANSSNGVAMRGFAFGGQTKIAYTQNSNLNALEVTDLDKKGKRTTSSFFNGTKPEYPRRMHCIQGSDAHRMHGEVGSNKNLGVGERITDVKLKEVSFNALKELFTGNDFARTRPRRKQSEKVFDHVKSARDEGANIVQDFHESMAIHGGKLYAVIADACAFANTNGGTIYIGLSANPKKDITGINNITESMTKLEKEISTRISPALTFTIDSQQTDGKNIIRVLVPHGDDPPYAVDDHKIYVRTEADTSMAVRDEIVELVKHGVSPEKQIPIEEVDETKTISPPRTGVEVVAVEERKGTQYFTVRDLRNGNVVTNVTVKSARKLWHYAIKTYKSILDAPDSANIDWQGDIGLLNQYKLGKELRYDLLQKCDGKKKYFFGVTDDGIHSEWSTLIGEQT